MPVLTSLYLCNSTVYAAVGSPTANGAKITAACQTELPEGCLINGIITNEAELTAALQGFFAANELPTQRVALAAGGSQFNHRVLTLPRMSERKRAAVLTREFSTGGADATAPLDDYMLLSTDKKTKADTVLATRVESAVIETYINLAAACGLKLYSIDLALAGQIKLVRATPELAGKSFVVLQFDGDSLIAGLYEKGQYKYSTRSRLFNPRGTEASGTEIGQKLSGLIQFQTAAKSEHPIKAVYFGGSTAADLAACTPGLPGFAVGGRRLPQHPQHQAAGPCKAGRHRPGRREPDCPVTQCGIVPGPRPGSPVLCKETQKRFVYGNKTKQLLSAIPAGR